MSRVFDLLDFSMPAPLAAAIVIALLQPLYLWLGGRITWLRARNALQFLFSAVGCTVLWIAVVALFPALWPRDYAEAVLSLMALVCGMLVYLEIWGLMSRGYTLGILLTLLNAGRPLTEAEIAARYRGGEGLDWIMRHRLGGMLAARVIVREDDRLVLTPVRGLLTARLYEISIKALGLNRTG